MLRLNWYINQPRTSSTGAWFNRRNKMLGTPLVLTVISSSYLLTRPRFKHCLRSRQCMSYENRGRCIRSCAFHVFWLSRFLWFPSSLILKLCNVLFRANSDNSEEISTSTGAGRYCNPFAIYLQRSSLSSSYFIFQNTVITKNKRNQAARK